MISCLFRLRDMGDATEAGRLAERNARCLAVITGREISQEHRHPTFDLIAKLGARRLKWAGQILRLEPEDSLVHQMLVATAMHDLTTGYHRRSLLMDAEEYTTVEELLELAADRKR